MNILPYIETHIVDHCNLNCKGCSHFSPLSGKWFADIQEFKNDLFQLKKITNEIEMFRIMGGEPLLHPEINEFLKVYRNVFDKGRLAIVTNALLLPNFIKNHHNIINELNVEIHITQYPTKKQKIYKCKRLLKKFNIRFDITANSVFYKHISLTKQQSADEAFDYCRNYFNCPALKNGKIYQCSGLAYVNIFAEYFNVQIEKNYGFDIYKDNIDIFELNNFINSPNKLCENCFYRQESSKWSESKHEIDEWLINEK